MSPEPLDVDADNVIPPEEFPAYEDAIYDTETHEITEEVIVSEDEHEHGHQPGADDTDETDSKNVAPGTVEKQDKS